MARVPGPLTRRAAAVLAAAVASWHTGPASAGAPAAEPAPVRWFAPVPEGGRAFPVLRSEQRWLNWRDTYGAPRMRLQPDGTWRQTGSHQGIDVYAEKGAPVVAMAPGRVENVGWTFYSGWRVGIRGTDGKYYFYAHLSSFAPNLAQGRSVAVGRLLGRVGSSGYGPRGAADEFPAHLHLGVQGSGEWENPQPLLAELYQRYVERTREGQAAAAGLRRRERLLLARQLAPGAPGREEAARARAALLADEAGRAAQVYLTL